MDDCIPIDLVSSYNDSPVYSSTNQTLPSYSFYINMSFLDHLENNSNVTTEPPKVQSFEHVESVLYTKVVIAICAFGILGNLLNLIVLTQKSLQKSMDRMERSAHLGLVAMALSDMLFGIVVLPHAWISQKGFVYDSLSFELYYSIYSEAIINIFIMSSTLLTVTIATSRYMAIVHPLRAREVIGMTFARSSIVLVFVICILFNLPRFWNETIDFMDCVGGARVYFRKESFLKTNKIFMCIYMWTYFLCGILVPLLWLTYCNVYLIRALRQSARMRKQYQPANNAASESTHRITLTLVIIVIMYITLVSPAEIINFCKIMVIASNNITPTYNLTLAVLNSLQAINFSCNFVLYCVINVHFRTTVRDVFCRLCKKKEPKLVTTGSGYYAYDSMTTAATTAV